ncbi:MAG: DUF3459 domain-containing protein [Actinomadura sp.]
MVFTREPGFGCAVNLSDQPVRVPTSGEPILAGGPVDWDGEAVDPPPHTAIWWSSV